MRRVPIIQELDQEDTDTCVMISVKHLVAGIYILLSFGCKAQQVITAQLVASQPIRIDDDGLDFEGTSNLILVPENRANPKSRSIVIQYFHLKSKEASNLPPVFFLGAGPGEPYDIAAFYNGSRAKAWTWELEQVNQKRDVILLNQRGNHEAPGIQINDFKFRFRHGEADKPLDAQARKDNIKNAYREKVNYYQEQGVDLAGYDIINFTDDIESVRKLLGASKIALIGNSFGSQWALAYMQRYPDHVDRTLLSCVEPLDHNYDDPQGVWQVLQKIDTYAQADTSIAHDLPDVGLIEAYKEIVRKLDASLISIPLDVPSEEINDTILLGADDLRFDRMNPFARGRLERIESWPKYITEMYDGDYRTLALLAAYYRGGRSSRRMIDPLVNNSLGISDERKAIFDSREANNWLGDINATYTATKTESPAKVVEDSFRSHRVHSIPTIIIHGDMDMSTPYENATFLMDYLEMGHLITVVNGTHAAKRSLIFEDEELASKIYRFMNLDFEETHFGNFKESLPSKFKLKPFNFWPIDGESIFEKQIK